MNIIALTGEDECGKDTVSQMLAQIISTRRQTAVIKAFAEEPKKLLAANWGIPPDNGVEWCDLLKKPSSSVGAFMNDHEGQIADTGVSGRQFIRNFMQKHKEVFGDWVWASLVLPPSAEAQRQIWKLDDGSIPHFCIISDLRFDTEARAVKLRSGDRNYHGEIWAIRGRGTGNNGDFDWTAADRLIDNSGDLDQLRISVESAFNAFNA